MVLFMYAMKTLIIAFDGLDKKLVEKFDLENLLQEENGSIDNKTGMSRIITSELFASFVTGKTHEDHGAKGLHYYDNGIFGSFIEKTVARPFVMQNIRGSHRLHSVLLSLFDVERRRYTKEDLKTDSLFEKIDNSRAMFVPGHSPDLFWETRCEGRPLKYGYGSQEYLEFWDTRTHRHRKESLMSEISFMSRPLLMCHFHKPDLHQHIYGDKDGKYDEEKLLKLYKETDKLAADIKERALETGYEQIIFMSDHGLPEGNDHNENAFYSSNKELFPEKTPKITDFHDRILQLVDE